MSIHLNVKSLFPRTQIIPRLKHFCFIRYWAYQLFPRGKGIIKLPLRDSGSTGILMHPERYKEQDCSGLEVDRCKRTKWKSPCALLDMMGIYRCFCRFNKWHSGWRICTFHGDGQNKLKFEQVAFEMNIVTWVEMSRKPTVYEYSKYITQTQSS